MKKLIYIGLLSISFFLNSKIISPIVADTVTDYARKGFGFACTTLICYKICLPISHLPQKGLLETLRYTKGKISQEMQCRPHNVIPSIAVIHTAYCWFLQPVFRISSFF